MKTLGKPHYVLNQDFYYWKKDKMNKVSKGQEYTWNGCAYSPKNYDEKLNQGITLGEDFVENGGLFNQKVNDVSETEFLNEISNNNISRTIKELVYKDYFNEKASFKKQRDADYEQLSHEDKEAFTYYNHAIDLFKKYNGYLTLAEEHLIARRGKEFLNIDESKFEKYKLMKEKDLALDFAIIFGIKPEEVPSKSSGIKMKSDKEVKTEKYIKECKEDEKKYPNIAKLWLKCEGKTMSESLGEFLNEPKLNNKLATTVEGIKQQLQKYSNMENSKLEKSADAMKDIARDSGMLPLDSDKYTGIGKNENSVNNEKKKQTESIKYQVNFKTDDASILISENMVNELMIYDSRSNINGYNTSLNLLWASDEYTGEKICLDSSSILSINKFK